MTESADVDLIELRCCRVDLRTRSVLREDRGARLSTKEAELLRYLIDNGRRPISREELLQQVWGYDPSVVSRTADTTIQRLRSKIERDPRQPEHIVTEHGMGYRFEPLGSGVEVALARAGVDATFDPDTTQTNIRPESSRFVGRQDDLRRLQEALADTRLVTLRGPGGTGKTRLARRFALDVLDHGLAGNPVDGGIFFIDLAPTRTRAEVVGTVARALSVSLAIDHRANDPAGQLGHAVAGRGPTLLLFDNCEQVLVEASEVAQQLFDKAPRLWILATSREPLRLSGEQVLDLDPLPVAEAVELFVVRAQAVRPGFKVLDMAELVALVEALDRLPLAIELAAARTGLLSPDRILSRLNERFSLLSRGPRDAVPRQRTLRGAIDWSWELLNEDERRALAWCGVFRGPFAVEAAEFVLQGEDDSWALDLLENLRERSLMQPHIAPADPTTPRLRLLESVRAYAAERLEARGETEAAEALHRDWFVARGEALADRLRGAGARQAMAELGLSIPDLVAVHERWAVRAPKEAVRAALAAIPWLFRQGPIETHHRLLDDCARIAESGALPLDVQCRVHLRQCMADSHVGRAEIGEVAGNRALELARAAGDRLIEGRALLALSVVQRNRGRTAEGEVLTRQALAIHEADGHGADARHTRLSLAFTAWKQGRWAEAEDLYRNVLGEARACGDQADAANALSSLGLCLMDQGRPADAERPLREAMDLHVELQDRRGQAVAAGNLARLSVSRGDLKVAREWYVEALAGLRAVGDRRLEGIVTRNLGVLWLSLGSPREAEEHFRFALAVARETEDRWNEGNVLSDLAEVLMVDGRHAEAMPRYEEAIALAGEVNDVKGGAIARGNLAVCHHVQGDLEAADRLNRQSRDQLAGLSLPRAEAYFLAYGAFLAAEGGDLPEARALVDAALEALQSVGDNRGLALARLARVGVTLAEARAGGTTEQREAAEDRAQEMAAEPDPDVSSESLHSVDTRLGRKLLRRLLNA